MDDSTQRKKPVVRRMKHSSGISVISFDTVLLNDWLIKASASTQDSIFIVMKNTINGEVIVSFFSDEVQANDFINYYVQV